MIRYPALRWDNSEVGLIGNYVLYYPFKLNMPNLIYGIRKFVYTLRGYYEEPKSDERLLRKKE
jgi:hypothetical protein